VGRENGVSRATSYGLDGPEIQSLWERGVPHHSRPALGTTQSPIQWAPGLFPWGKEAGTWRWQPTPI